MGNIPNRENRLQKRKETLFELIHEFDNSEIMLNAKKILDGFTLGKLPNSEKDADYFSTKHLPEILRFNTHQKLLIKAKF